MRRQGIRGLGSWIIRGWGKEVCQSVGGMRKLRLAEMFHPM
jgi:hypothetical protein